MVFEAVVVELLNKFLKQYIENLDTSQLKIGIWGGDVVLKDLKIKSTLCDGLNLPVRVKWGKLGKLAMKIPWKNLYSSQVVVEVEDLLVLIVPNSELTYDAVKEEKWAQEKKQARLRAIEEAKKRELEQVTAKQGDGFVEKLVTQITKNLQIDIRNIHIRYEDKSTIPGSPFSVGVTLCNLSALTTLSDPTMNFSKLMQENEHFICKVVNLEGLAVYWNSNSELFSDLPNNDLVDIMIQSIPRSEYKPKGFMYLFGPLSASAFLRLNPKPELDGSNFTIPKVFVNVHLKEIELAVTHKQFCELMSYLQDFHRFMAASKYRKYRPVGISVIGHVREWWRFAYVAVLEDIIRRKREWCWENIKGHRETCRKYAALFKVKLNSKKMTAEEGKMLNELEKKLNVFNLVLIREQVYVEVARNVKEHKGGGWFSGWFGSGTESKTDSNGDELVKKIQSVMTSQEKQKLYKAIGYEESAPPTSYPVTFVQVQFWFHLDEIKTTVYDDRKNQLVNIMTLSVRSVRMEFEQRPAAFAMKFVIIIGNFQVIGKQEEDGSYPKLVTSNCTESQSLIELLYEKNPLEATCDQRVIVNARPLSIIFHAATINLVRDVFRTDSPREVEIIVAATSASLPTFQRITSLGLQYAIEKQTVLELKVNIMSSHLIIPYGGAYHPNKDMLVLLLGKLSVETEESCKKSVSVKKLFLEGTTDEEIFSTVLSASYTNFKCSLTGVQVLFQLSGEDWVAASKKQKSSLQFLEPTNLEVIIKKSLVMDDPRIPKMIIEGKMPSLAIHFQEERFLSFVTLASSIPTTSERPGSLLKKANSASVWSIQSFSTQLESKFMNIQKDFLPTPTPEYTQGINLVAHFEMNELTVTVSKTRTLLGEVEGSKDSKPGPSEMRFLHLRVVKLEMHFTNKTFEVIHLFKLGGIDFKQYHNRGWLPFVSTKLGHDYLFIVEFINLDSKIPDFYTAKGGIVNRLTLNLTPLTILLEKDALLAQLQFVTNVQRRIELVKETLFGGRAADAGRLRDTIYEDSGEFIQIDKKVLARGKRFRKKTSQKEVIDFFLQASLDEIDVVIEFEGHKLADFALKGGSIDISTQKSYTTLDVNLREVCLLDLNEQTKHPRIVWSLEKQTLASRITLYNKEYFGSENSLDMSIDLEVGGIQCTVVTLFFSRAFEFLSAFQSQIETLIEGVTIAAEKAKENVVKAFHNAAEICLKVKITAPIFQVPTTSVSLETIAIDLGVLTIKNSITELDYTPDGEPTRRPLIDSLRVHLQNLKMSRCTLGETMEVEQEKNFIVPVTFDLNVKRNLSKGWFKVIPELEILARLATVRVTLTHDDLCAIMNIIRENLKEGEEGVLKKAPASRKFDHRTSVKVKEKRFTQYEVLAEMPEVLAEDDQTAGTAKYFTVVKFMFFMDSFIFDATSNSPYKKEETGLARFVLESMSIKGRVFSNNFIHTSVTLVSCVLDDTRPGKVGRLTRLMERTIDPAVDAPKEEATRTNSMLEIIYQKKDNDCFVDVRVYKFTLILSMDFLQKLGEFFTVSSAENLAQPVRALDKQIQSASERDLPTFTVNLRLEKPDIIFVENMDSVNTDALIFHTEMVLKYRLAGEKQVITGTLRDIELYSCCFNPASRPHTMNQVIKPFTVSIAGSTPEDSGLHVDICFTEIFVSINPGTVDLISKCHEALLKDVTVSERDAADKSYLDLWDIKPFNTDDYWFFRAEEAWDALSMLRSRSSIGFSDSLSCDQICLLAIPSITVFVEGLTTSRAQPLISVEMGFQMRCYNWSHRMSIMNSLTLQVQYYNPLISHWEPLVEPIEKYANQDRKPSYIPWELNCSVVYGDEGQLDNLRPPKVQITLSCSDILQLTVSKTCVDVLKTTLEKFSSAATKHVVKKLPDLPPYVVKNETGYPVELLLEESKLQVCKSLSDEYSIVRLDGNSEVELMNAILISSELNRNISLSAIKKETHLFVKFPVAKDQVFEMPLGQNSKLYHPFHHGGSDKQETWALVSEVDIVDNSTTVVLRTVFKIINYFNEPINIHSLSEDKTVAEFIGAVEGNSSFNLPFQAVYSGNKKLFFSVNGYSLSGEPFDWGRLNDDPNMACLLQCTSKMPESHDPFFIQAIGETEQIHHAKRKRKSAGSIIYRIHLQPTVKIFNSLPFSLVICSQGSAKEMLLHPGNKLQMSNAEPGNSTVTVRIPDYLEKEWSCKESIVENPPEFLIWKFITYNGLAPETLNLGVHVTYKRKTAEYAIYCPYFMVNKTEHLLSYRFGQCSTVFFHPGNMKSPVMFSPVSKKFFGKKSASLQVDQSSWSETFPVDVAGSGGTVQCKDNILGMVYKISVSISLTYNSLTKVVVFTPYYVLINSMDYELECRECNPQAAKWLVVPAKSYTPFWPKSQDKDNTLCIRPKDSIAITPAFSFHSTDVCLLRLPHKWGGIYVNIKATQSGTYISFSSYEAGQAPVLIMNHSPKSITLHELNTQFSVKLRRYEQVLHTWVSPTGVRKLFIYGPKQEKHILPLDQDDDGVLYTENDDRIRFVTFLDGTQRVLLFTDDPGLSRSISSMRLSSSGLELICKIQGIGVSLVNDLTRLEILYLTFVSSGITWETRKIGKTFFKQMRDVDAQEIEAAYQKYLDDAEEDIDLDPVVSVSDRIKVNFEKMELLEPVSREMRRTFEPGLWLAYRQIEEQVMLHMKVNRIQVDSQLLDCAFPVVLAPVPPPKTIAYQGPKPFFELSVVKTATSKSGVEQYRYFKTLVQEFHVKVDIGFVQHVYMFLAVDEMTDEQEKVHFKKELEFMEQPLKAHVEVVATNELKNFYDLLHFSPLKIHFSFSMAGKLETNTYLPPSFSVMLQSLGVTLTDIHDVVFRLSFFERKSVFLTNKELINEIISHYYGQIVRQAYVLLLGLDVIGNPYGLIVGIGEGVEALFYEPFQGIIQGPSEFGKGVAIGWKRMVGHTVGSAAGTLGKLTGTLGKGLAVLSLDREYQIQRMVEQSQQGNIQSSMARGGRGMVMGVLEGVSGIVSKPIEGAKQEGVGGFFKGMGKGMMGLMTRPVTGIVDFASTSLNAVKRATVISAENKRLRPPRHFRSESVLEPYNLREAQGHLIFYLICRRKYCNTDKYQYHLYLREKEVVLLTNKRIILAEYSEVFGTWQEHMAITWKSMPDRPRCHTKGVALTMPLRQGTSKKDVKVLLVDDESVREEIFKKMIELYQLEKQQDEES